MSADDDYRLDDVPTLKDLEKIAGTVESKKQNARNKHQNQSFIEDILHEDEMPETHKEEFDEEDLQELHELGQALDYERESERRIQLKDVANQHENLHEEKALGDGLGTFILYSDQREGSGPSAYLVPRAEGIEAVVFNEQTSGNWDAEDVYRVAELNHRTAEITPETISMRDEHSFINILGSEYDGQIRKFKDALESLEGVHAEPELVDNSANMEEIDRLEKTTYRILNQLEAQTFEISGNTEKTVERVSELTSKHYGEAQLGFPSIDLGY